MAVIRSTIFSWTPFRLTTNMSLSADRIRVATRRRLSCVFRSASSLAEEAPTPNMIPADVGDERRDSTSGIRSLSRSVHCRSIGNQPSHTSFKEFVWKNLGSLNASATSFLHDLDASGIRDIVFSMSSKLAVMFCGNVFHRNVGVSTCADIVIVAVVIRSGSTRILDMLGKIEAMMATTSSGSSGLRSSRESEGRS